MVARFAGVGWGDREGLEVGTVDEVRLLLCVVGAFSFSSGIVCMKRT